MNLNTIAITPFAQGIIKVDSEQGEEPGSIKTKPSMVVCARHHHLVEGATGKPQLAAHPIQTELLESEVNKAAGALVEVPVKMFFDKSENTIGIQYKAYDLDTGAPTCSGNGKDASRVTIAGDGTQTLTQVACPGAEMCAFARTPGTACRRQMKMTVQIDGQDDPLSVFEVRSSSINNYRTLTAQLRMIERRFGGLRHVPLKLQMWRASNVASQYEAFDLLRLAINAPSDAEALRLAKSAREEAQTAGLVDVLDDVFTSVDMVSDPIGLLGDDFQMVSDFYEPAQPARRVTAAQTAITGADAKRAETTSNMAGNLIADAVRLAGEVRPQELEAEIF